MSYYSERKERVRSEAITFELWDRPLSSYEVTKEQQRLRKLARRYGLMKELKENGII